MNQTAKGLLLLLAILVLLIGLLVFAKSRPASAATSMIQPHAAQGLVAK